MENSNQTVIAFLRQSIKEAFEHYRQRSEGALLSDIYLQPLEESNELRIYDDEERELGTYTAVEVVGDFSTKEIEEALVFLLSERSMHQLFSPEYVLTPFSFIIVNERFEHLSEQFMLDNDSLLLDDKFMQHMDDEITEFMHQLFGDNAK